MKNLCEFHARKSDAKKSGNHQQLTPKESKKREKSIKKPITKFNSFSDAPPPGIRSSAGFETGRAGGVEGGGGEGNLKYINHISLFQTMINLL